MCTVSWIHSEDGYSLFSNRDEKRIRPAALAPRVHEQDGIRYVSPIDTSFGGAWIAVNEFGVSLCLLNGAGDRGRGQRSRGWVVSELATARSTVEAEVRLGRCDLSVYAPFTLLVLEPFQDGLLAEWSGEWLILSSAENCQVLASSSFDYEGVRQRRAVQLGARRRQVSPELLREFHRSHADGPGPYSPCMHRSDACTVSFTSVFVNDRGIEMRYQPGSPCEGLPESEVKLCCNSSSLLPAR